MFVCVEFCCKFGFCGFLDCVEEFGSMVFFWEWEVDYCMIVMFDELVKFVVEML